MPKDEREAVRWFRLAADQGDVGAQFNLGNAYIDGLGVPKDEREAVRWMRLAADQGFADAQFSLGFAFANGLGGVPKDEREAVRWYRLAADQQYAVAQYNLGVMYANGQGVPKDEREAVRWYRLAADQQYAGAQYNLGVMYADGQGVPKNELEAVRWFRLAADQGQPEAQRYLGLMYEEGLGVSKDEREALRWYRLAADQGNASAQNAIGTMYGTGQGVPKDEREAFRWCHLAAGQGHAVAQHNVGWAYANGRGVPKDEGEAIRWYHRAADQGFEPAQCNLGWSFEQGLGVPVDYEKAVYWNRLAAEKGFPEACNNLGWLYENGLGVARNPNEAMRWYEAAVRQEHPEAQQRLFNFRNRSLTDQRVLGDDLRNDDSITKFLEDAFAGFVGLESVRDEVFRQASYIQVQKLRAGQGLRVPTSPSRHLVFLGNPGTGKTTIARIIAALYHRLGILKTDKVVETDRAGLVAAYIGQTALKTRDIVESTLGGVLFIDEAYTLARSDGADFGKEAIETLLKMMEDHREELIVIVAGYEAEMDSFIKFNPGLASRFNRYIRFPDYTPEELLTIFVNFCKGHSYAVSETIHYGLRAIFGREIQAQRQRFSNARYVRNLFEKVIEAQAHRLFTSGNTSQSDLQTIMPSDVESALGESLPAESGPSGNYEAALQRLNGLIGLDGAKKQVKRLFDYIRVQRLRAESGVKVAEGFSQHLVFIGNPGTGKTTVARIIADLYFGLGIIPSNRIVEVDRSALVAGYVGQSAIKTRQVVDSALGGVLFIDEAYTLSKGGEDRDFGQEVIDTLLKAMEDHRGELVVIVAGYRELMHKFIDSNPGLRSRFNRYIEFEDYKPDELVAIFDSFCRAVEYGLDDSARTFLSENCAKLFDAGQTIGNGRFVRNLFERCVELQSQRISRNAEMMPETLNAITLFDVAGALKEVVNDMKRK